MATVAHYCGSAFQKAAMPPEPVCQLALEQYEEMIRSGIIMEDDPVELLNGWLVPKMTQNPPYALASDWCETFFKKWCRKVGVFSPRSRSGGHQYART